MAGAVPLTETQRSELNIAVLEYLQSHGYAAGAAAFAAGMKSYTGERLRL